MKPFPWKRKAEEAREAAERAKKEWQSVVANRAYAHEVAGNIREHRRKNHFADSFRKIIEG